MPNAALLTNAELYDPVRILQDPAFRIINSKDELPKEKDANLACPCLFLLLSLGSCKMGR